MRYEDTIQIKALYYNGYSIAVVSDTPYICNSDGEITSEVAPVDMELEVYDDKGYPITPQEEWVDYSKCFISFNSAASKVRLNDGSEYMYSYYVILPLKKATYHLIPREGEYVRIRKADGTIDAEMQVRGFVTYKKRYLKIWL